MSKNVGFVFMIMFSGLLFYRRVITRTIFSLKNLGHTGKQGPRTLEDPRGPRTLEDPEPQRTQDLEDPGP